MEIRELLPIILGVIGFLVGWMLRTIEKKVDKAETKTAIHDIEIREIKIKEASAKKASDLATAQLIENMSAMALKLTEYMDESRGSTETLNNIVGLHELKIQNLEAGANLTAIEIRHLKKSLK